MGCSPPARTRPTNCCAPAPSMSARPQDRPHCSPVRTARPSRSSTSTRRPEWSAIGTWARTATITGLEDLKGASIAADQGHRPLLLPAAGARGGRPVALRRGGCRICAHADGRAALDGGSVDAWAGLDPIMAPPRWSRVTSSSYPQTSTSTTYGFLNATEDFTTNHHRPRAWLSSTRTSRRESGRSRTLRRLPRCSPRSPASTPKSPPP